MPNRLALLLCAAFASAPADASEKPAGLTFNFKVHGYSTYAVYLDGYKILDESAGANGVKMLGPFAHRGKNTLTVTAGLPSEGASFDLRISSDTKFATTNLTDNDGNVLRLDHVVAKTELTIKDVVDEPFWDANGCSDRAAVGALVRDLNNAYVAADFEGARRLLTGKLQHDARVEGSTEDKEARDLQRMMKPLGEDLQKLDPSNQAEHIQVEVVKAGTLYKARAVFKKDDMQTGIEQYVGCVHGKPQIVL